MSNLHKMRGHAIVVGASIAGLCAAQVLSDHYQRVTVVERDELPDTPTNRAAVPQGRHLHLLMARGGQELGDLFPGLLDDMVAAGVPKLANRPDCIYFGGAGHILGTASYLRKPFTAYVPSRPHLEWQLRGRVRNLKNTTIVRRSVAEPRYDPTLERVIGVVLDPDPSASATEPAGTPEFLAADLVVDASGRGSRLPGWLTQWGYQRPPEEVIDVGISYASHFARIPDGMIDEKVIVNGASRDQPLGLGMLRYEDRTWILTTFGVAKVKPPATFDQMRALAIELLPARFSAALQHAEPVGSPAFHSFPTSRWRRYHKLDRYPAGIVPFGDAVASFNPTFGQGMTMASLQAGQLRQALQSPGDHLAVTLNRATARTLRPVWRMNAVVDTSFHHAAGPTSWWYRPAGWLFDRILAAAETEPVLAEWFLRRFSLLDNLYLVPPPMVVGRAITHDVRRSLAARRQ
ncbi:MAG: oxidoreductase [Mycobacteriaceae bacterium]|nr:oxidoreductase [Mycobacteriaceae bacterium]